MVRCKVVVFYLFFLVFISHTVLAIGQLLLLQQPTQFNKLPFYSLLAQQTLLFDRPQMFFQNKSIAIHYPDRTITSDIHRFNLRYMDALLFLHGVPGHEATSDLLQRYFCDLKVQERVFPGLSGHPDHVALLVGSSVSNQQLVLVNKICL